MYATVTSAFAEASVAYGNTESKIGKIFQDHPQLTNLELFLPRKSLKKNKLKAAVELAGQMLLLPLKTG